MTYQINYSFTLGFDMETVFSVNIPVSRLEGRELDLNTIRSLVDDDSDLLLELLGAQELKVYESMLMAPHLYRKELQRFDESVRIVSVPTGTPAVALTDQTESSLDAGKVEATLRQFISAHIDYDIHKNFEQDEETGNDFYPELAKHFVRLYKGQ